MAIIIGLTILILLGVFIYRQFNSDAITANKLKKYFLYILLLIGLFIIYLIINN
ncbi:MAG: hypothetical protein LC100_13930 [Chitinophagales bacterium]|nr:hypothetical protein [Chitinophagales bacterium]